MAEPEQRLLMLIDDEPAQSRLIAALAAREGWRTVRCSRGGIFEVIELWLENALMVEVLTAEMQADYRSRAKVGIWRERVGPVAA